MATRRGVVVDDDHSGRREVRIGAAEPARPDGDVAGRMEQHGVELGVLGDVQLPVYECSYDIATSRSLGSSPGIEGGLLGVGGRRSSDAPSSAYSAILDSIGELMCIVCAWRG